jgi:hypothetical protein
MQAAIDGGACSVDYPVKVGQDGKARATDDPHYGDTTATSCWVSIDAASTAGHHPAERFQVADVTKSFRDNLGYATRASAENLQVEVDESAGMVRITVKPSQVLNEADILTIGSATALVASKAIWTTYPEAQAIYVDVDADVTDQFGATSTKPVAESIVNRGTGSRFIYDGLRDRVNADNKLFYCISDHYVIAAFIYVKLKDRGCLAAAGPVK